MQAFRTNPKKYLEEHSIDECTLGATLLHFAVFCNKPHVVTALLNKAITKRKHKIQKTTYERSPVFAGDDRNHSPLLYALWFGHTAIAQNLVETLVQQRKDNLLGALTLSDTNDRCILSYIAQNHYRFLNDLITHHGLLTQPNND
jgi:ankyrin repeat protein